MPVSEQRVLDVMESELEGGEPRLGSMFAIFTRLTRDEGAPRTESLWPEPRRIWPASGLPRTLRAVIAVPLVLGLVALLIFMAVSGSVQGCRPGWAPHGTTITRATVCQSAGEPQGHS
jgi:hypothetical protein